MFGLMKNSVKDTPAADGAKLAELYEGCVVGFGFMPQKSVSGKRVPVTEVNSYLFDSDSFVSYRLVNDTTDVSLIVADGDDPTGTYLALSQRVEQRLFAPIFASALPNQWFTLKEGHSVTVAPQRMGHLQGWLTQRYTLAVAMKGRFFEGDYRLRKQADRTRLSRPFDYLLLIDEDNKYALEVEKYEDGVLHVFATIYRPATDIGEIVRAPKLTASNASAETKSSDSSDESKLAIGLVEAIAHVPPRAPLKPPVVVETFKPLQTGEPKMPIMKLEQKPEAIIPVLAQPLPKDNELSPLTKSAEAKTKDKEESKVTPIIAEPPHTNMPPRIVEKAADMSTSASQLHCKFGRIKPASVAEKNSETLSCDVGLASRLIDEAQRNHMALSELIRKVIDLPARVQDMVLIPFSLNPAEFAELARRYNIPASDTQAVKQRILEELSQFTGKKK